jgi:hypothetical protein
MNHQRKLGVRGFDRWLPIFYPPLIEKRITLIVMRLLILVPMLQFCLNLSAQKSYVAYYEGVSNARVLGSNDAYDSAVIVFKKTFEDYERIFPQDAEVAMRIAALNNDTVNVAWFFERATPYGMSIHVLDSTSWGDEDVFIYFRRTSVYQQLVKRYPERRHIFEQGINLEYSRKLTVLNKRLYDAYDPIKRFFGKAMRIQRDTAASMLSEYLELYKEYGTPSFLNVVRLHGDSIDPKNVTMTAFGWNVFWIHNTAFEIYDHLLRKAMLDGELHLYAYAAIYDHLITDPYVRYKKETINRYRYFYGMMTDPTDLKKKDLDRINANRRADGLMSYEEYHKLYNGMYKFKLAGKEGKFKKSFYVNFNMK